MTAIVIIDDHTPSRVSIRRAALAPEVSASIIGEFATGEDAQRRRELQDADILLVDFDPPGDLDGATLVRRLRAKCPSASIIACGVFQGSKSLDAAFDAGADRCLRKPLRNADLRRTLAELSPAGTSA